MNLTTFVQSINHTNTCRHTKLYIASITKSYSKRIHVSLVPTFIFTIDGTVLYLSLLYLEIITTTFRTSKFLNNNVIFIKFILDLSGPAIYRQNLSTEIDTLSVHKNMIDLFI